MALQNDQPVMERNAFQDTSITLPQLAPTTETAYAKTWILHKLKQAIVGNLALKWLSKNALLKHVFREVSPNVATQAESFLTNFQEFTNMATSFSNTELLQIDH